MNNITALQRKLLSIIQSPQRHVTAYFIGDFKDQEIREVLPDSDTLFVFSMNPEAKERMLQIAKDEPKLKVLDKLERKDCQLLVIDSHINGKMFGFELATLKAMKAELQKNEPIILTRSEDPDQSLLLAGFMGFDLAYNSYFVQQFTGDLRADTVEAIWAMSVPRSLDTLAESERCESTGHPKRANPPVEYNIILETSQ